MIEQSIHRLNESIYRQFDKETKLTNLTLVNFLIKHVMALQALELPLKWNILSNTLPL